MHASNHHILVASIIYYSISINSCLHIPEPDSRVGTPADHHCAPGVVADASDGSVVTLQHAQLLSGVEVELS